LVPAIIFSSLLFALLHGSLLSLISTFSLGVIMAVIVIKTGSLWGGIIYHMLNNFYAATYLFWALSGRGANWGSNRVEDAAQKQRPPITAGQQESLAAGRLAELAVID